MFPSSRPLSPLVPYTFPPVSFLTLKDYLTNLVNANGGVYWPLDDVANNPYNRVINPAVAVGRNILLDGNGEGTLASWGAQNSAVITHQAGTPHSGTNVVRVAGNGTVVSAQAIQTQFQVGRAYQVSGWFRSDGTSTPSCGFGAPQFTGTTSTSWQQVTLTIVITSGTFQIRSSLATGYIEFDDFTITELNIPASTAIPVQLLNTDVWNGLGVAAWTAVNSATVSAISVARHDGVTGTVIKIAYNGVANPIAKQSPLAIGTPYRVYGWVAKTSTATSNSTPRITHNGVTIVMFGGTNSTDWQPYDFIFVATATDIDFGINGGSAGSEVIYDVTVVALDTGIRQDNVVSGGDFAADKYWTKGSGVTIAGGVAHTDGTITAGTLLTQASIVVPGKRYKVVYTIKNYVQGQFQIDLGTAVGTVVVANGTYTDIIIANGANVLMVSRASSLICDIDDVVITELSPLVALPVNGAILGNSEAPLRIGTSVSFDGVNDLINPYSAQLNSILPTGSKTFNIFVKINLAALTDGVSHVILRFQIDVNNFVLFSKTTTNNTFSIQIVTSGANMNRSFTISAVGWHLFSAVYDSATGIISALVDGVVQGATVSSATDWVGNLVTTTTVFGASTTAPVLPWSGSLAHFLIENIAESAANLQEAAKLGDTV